MVPTMTSIAQDFPYDILSQIFLLSLPSDPLNHRQPDVTQAPMLLCHICSHWRSVALNTPTIWAKIYVLLSIIYEDQHRSIRTSDLEFLHWWRENVGGLSPSLRLQPYEVRSGNVRAVQLSDINKLTFLINILSSAQYLDLDHDFSRALREMLGDNRPLVCPNLQTLIIRQDNGRKSGVEDIIPTNAAQPIRRLFIEGITLTLIDAFAWSHLTHICAADLRITLDYWFALIRQCVNLVSGDFSITITGEQGVFKPSPTATLPRLRQLVIFTFGSKISISVFQDLKLPSLTTLRLDHFPSLSITHLHSILSSTPALKELHLAPNNPWNEITKDIWIPGPHDTVTPLWHFVPNIELIHFAGREHKSVAFEDQELMSAALHSPWLGLGRPENQIKQVEFGVGPWKEEPREKWEKQVNKLRSETPNGVEFVVRAKDAPYLWDDGLKSNGSSLFGCFEDLKFQEMI